MGTERGEREVRERGGVRGGKRGGVRGALNPDTLPPSSLDEI